MEIRRVSFYEDFVCAASACRECCCKSWSIPVDEPAYAAYRREKGLLGLMLRIAIRGKEEPVLNAFRGRCLFLQKDGLCALQVKKGAEYPPYVCRIYPRKRTGYGLFAEEYLDLSCIEAAELFLKAPFPLRLTVTEGEVPYGRHGTNHDPAFLQKLSASRDALCALFEEADATPEGTDEAFRIAMAYATHWQDVSARGKDPFAQGTAVPAVKGRLFPMGIATLNEWVNGCVYSDDVKRLLPFLHRVLTLYMKRFDGISEAEGDRRLTELTRRFFSAEAFDARKYQKIFCYVLYRYYLETYEDYSFIRRVRDAVMHANLILLFDALWFSEHGKLSQGTQARIIAMYEKRVFHNAQIQKDMADRWRGAEYEAAPYHGGDG